MKSLITSFLLLIGATFSFSQTPILKGTLINKNTGKPIENARVSVLGVDNAESTTFGEYQLNLSKGDSKYQAGDFLDIQVHHEIYGFHTLRITIPSNFQHNIEIEPNNFISISGSVRDAKSGEPLAGIEVSIVPERDIYENKNSSLISITDKFGGYQIITPKGAIGGQNYVRYKFYDPSGKYFFIEKTLGISHQDVLLTGKSASKENLGKFIEEIKVRVFQVVSIQKPKVYIDLPKELKECIVQYSLDGNNYSKYYESGIENVEDELYIKIISTEGAEVGAIKKEGFLLEKEKELLKEFPLSSSNSFISCRFDECRIYRSLFNSIHAEKIGLSRYEDKNEVLINLGDYKNSDLPYQCFDPIKNFLPLAPSQKIYIDFFYPDGTVIKKFTIVDSYSNDNVNNYTLLTPLKNEYPNVWVKYVGTRFYGGESEYAMLFGFGGRCIEEELKLSYNLHGYGVVPHSDDSAYDKKFSNYITIKEPKNDTIFFDLYIKGELINSIGYLFEKKKYLDDYIRIMGPPKITCWVESEDKVRCSKGESAIEQFFPIQGIYYGFEKGKLNNWTSIENFLVDETISLDAKNPKDVIYYQFLYKDKNKSEILFEELIK